MTRDRSKLFFKRILLFAGFILIIEIGLRVFWGFGNVAVFVEDPDYEYIFAPDQDFNRLGQHFYTNHFSMRSDALSTNDSIRILFFGDSILNGGLSTDNENLATSILEKNLSAELKKKVRALNISSGSWGVDNAAAYLKKHGDFGAQLIVLVFSSHDYFDNMSFKKEVGLSLDFPDSNPMSAIGDFLARYLIPVIKFNMLSSNNERKESMYYLNSKNMNSGWDFFIQYAKMKGVPLLVYLHAEKDEIRAGTYNKYGLWLIEYLESAKIQHIEDLKHKPDPKLFRDFIHFNASGQQFMAHTLQPYLLNVLNN